MSSWLTEDAERLRRGPLGSTVDTGWAGVIRASPGVAPVIQVTSGDAVVRRCARRAGEPVTWLVALTVPAGVVAVAREEG
ncbi:MULTISPECIES: hypothetical protein [unclassified Crossiella]|uniref:hypothetical protein n=1 Tax=unclassified Crossiella TaxID=2620835 RepID=UPI001FFE5480|nr:MULTISPECIES: hypothetical protein [unclassified Crossiella]MCK2238120.1 hypothetical protein [Crossiella sp. S99.2]MCK2256160.1 hypothetical protein [Crossiella sp. S99.1]